MPAERHFIVNAMLDREFGPEVSRLPHPARAEVMRTLLLRQLHATATLLPRLRTPADGQTDAAMRPARAIRLPDPAVADPEYQDPLTTGWSLVGAWTEPGWSPLLRYLPATTPLQHPLNKPIAPSFLHHFPMLSSSFLHWLPARLA